MSTIEGLSAGFNAIEVHQGTLRVTNSVLERNANGLGGSADANREGRGFNENGVVFVRASQPVIVNNIIRNNEATVININANALNADYVIDRGRARGATDRFTVFVDNQGPLVRMNRLVANDMNGMSIRGETLNTEGVWDDTDIVHVVPDVVYISDFHTSGGLRLESAAAESLVVKFGPDAGITATGRPLDIDDRVGGMLHIVGAPGFPVFLTSVRDDSVGAGFQPNGQPQVDTNGDGLSAGSPGDWRSILIDQFAHDRNVNIITELEAADVTAPGVNADTNNAQLLGALAPFEKAGDENLRLGFTVQGVINARNDIDVYSFSAKAGTEVWFDIDRTSQALDAVIDLLDANGNLIAQSNNSYDESMLGGDPYNDPTRIPDNHVNVLEKSAYYPTHTVGTGLTPKDHFTLNPRDPGMRVVLPGDTAANAPANTYHIRIRSSNIDPLDTTADPADLQDPAKLNDGLTSGNYQLNVRLGELDELPGSTVRYADLRYATNGIEVIGHPQHSPLLGEATERLSADGGDLNNTSGGADQLGNLLSSDRAALSVAGRIANATNDIDYFQFEVRYDSTQSGGGHASAIFDLDSADGLGRVNATLAVFDSAGRLVLVSRDSNIADDQAGPFQGIDVDDLSRGSSGVLDPYIGSVELPEGTYTVAVVSDAKLANQLLQTRIPNPPNSLVRLEPVDSIQRIAEEHFEVDSGGVDTPAGFSTAVRPVVTNLFGTTGNGANDARVEFNLGDVNLFVSRTNSNSETELRTVDPFTGQQETVISRFIRLQDIAMRPDGELFGFDVNFGSQDDDSNNGDFWNIDTAGNVGTQRIGDNGIVTYEFDNNGNAVVANLQASGARIGEGIEFEAISFGTISASGAGPLRLVGVGNYGNNSPQTSARTATRNILYQFDPFTGVATSAPPGNRTGNSAATGTATQIRELGVLDTTIDPVGGGGNVLSTPQADVITDGDTIGVNADVYEVNFGAEATLRVSVPGRTIQDGQSFTLDRFGDGTVVTTFEFDTGPVVLVTGVPAIPAVGPDGADFFVIEGRRFEFDPSQNGASFGIPIGYVPTSTSTAQLANLIKIAVEAAGIGVTVDILSNTRMSFTGDTSLSIGTTALSRQPNLPNVGYGCTIPGAICIDDIEEHFTLTRVGNRIVEFFDLSDGTLDGVGAIDGYSAGFIGTKLNFVDLTPGVVAPLGSNFSGMLNGAIVGAGTDGIAVGRTPINMLVSHTSVEAATQISLSLVQPSTTVLNSVRLLTPGDVYVPAQTDTPPFSIGGQTRPGPVTGTAFVAGRLFAVTGRDTSVYGTTSGGGIYEVGRTQGSNFIPFDPNSNSNTVNYLAGPADFLAQDSATYGSIPTNIDFVGLAAGPRNVENGRFANTLFAIDSIGRIYAFDVAGGFPESSVTVAPIFADGRSVVATGISGATGLDFSNLDVNLWHLTDRRFGDAGHGEPEPFNGSRAPTNNNGQQEFLFWL